MLPLILIIAGLYVFGSAWWGGIKDGYSWGGCLGAIFMALFIPFGVLFIFASIFDAILG